MSIYNITYSIITNLLNVPNRRKVNFIAWLAALMKPMQYNNDLFANDYVEGQLYSSFSAFAIYYPGDRITYSDNRNYEFIYANPFAISGMPPDGFPDYWIVLQDNFIGAIDRSKFNSQIIMLEWELNIWYKNPLPANQIYIGNNFNTPSFLLGATGATSSKLSNLSQNATVYLANVASFSNSDFTIYVPIALYNTLGSDATNRTNNVSRFVKKYKLAGISFNVTTY